MIDEPPVPARIVRLTARIADDPRVLRDEPGGEPLYQAVHGLDVLDLEEPETLARELAERDDSALRAEAVRITRAALHAGVLAPARARALLSGPLADVPGALRELAEPWAALDPLPHDRVRRLLGSGAADAAVEVAARHGHRDLLLGVAADPDRPPRLRRRALELLGDVAAREDVGDVVAVAASDPLLLGRPAFGCLGGLHRRGHFPDERHVPDIVRLALADHGVPAEDVAVLLYTRRHETLRELMAADSGTARRLELLVALDAQGGSGLDAGAAVCDAARAAADPVPYLRAIRELRHEAGEETVIGLVERAPRAALDALEAVGGDRAVAVLREGLGLDGGEIAPRLRPFAHRALELLWHLGGDPAVRHSILDRLDPRDLPRRIAADLGGPDPRELALLRAHLDPDEPAESLCRLARNGDAAALPAVADLLLRVVSDLAGAPDEGARPSVPEEVETALRGLGGRLFRRGAIRPRCLLDAAGAAEAGPVLVADMALDLLERPGLGARESAILLDLVRRNPHRRARARVHPLLRHRDRHVRGGAIAVIAGDAGDARALSASLIPLTAAGDAQTVRQALLALAEAGADGAAPAIAGRLDHPNMNVKKTAAGALARAGGPAAVPRLLFWLGHHDNPGFREELTAALRAILGGAFAATVLAAAERATEDRSRSLLLESLTGLLDGRAAAALARDGIVVEPAERAADALLLAGGWNAETARRVLADHDERGRPGSAVGLGPRSLLPHWLDLAGSDNRALRLVVDLCPPTWADVELEIFARSAETLAGGLAVVGRHRRNRLLALLGEAVPRLEPAGRSRVAARVRGLDLGAARLVVLRLCGAVPERDDLDQALAAAGRGPAPADEERAVLREAFGRPPVEDPAPLRESLLRVVHDPEALRAWCARTDVTSRARLDAMIDAFPEVPSPVRGALLDRMLETQPLGAPPWTLAEASRPAPQARIPRPDDLDQPRSKAQRRRLLAMLDGEPADRREKAARILLGWPEPATRAAVLRAYLQGRVEAGPGDAPALAGALADQAGTDPPWADEPGERFARLAAHIEPDGLDRLVPALVSCWEHGSVVAREAAARALRRAPADLVGEAVADRLAGGAWGFLDLLAGRPLLRTSALEAMVRTLHDEGRADLAERLHLVDGPLRDPRTAARADEAALRSLRERDPAAAREPSRDELFERARTGGPKEIRRALTRLAERHEEGASGRDPELEALIDALVGHRETGIRLLAHRVSRRVLDRTAYLEQTTRLLSDREPGVVRSAIRTVSHARWEPAIPRLVELLGHPRAPVREAAVDGLVLFGGAAVSALRHAEGRARPDRRPRYASVLQRIGPPAQR
ncbi:HEAT repeat domain-containing protein [Spirillospora sp. CA-128828]|uniref:HEAT repeat domain-containing protein n=1 Tax=Spirillospora sp. CA-128828 TaxID=3240033 RepID=UPI003D8D539D